MAITVYALHCTANGLVYVGSTVGLWKRYREHRSRLNTGKHNETQLLADWRLHGEQAFKMVALQELPDDCSIEAKRSAELDWMRFYKGLRRLYNRNLVSYGPTAETLKRGHSTEARRKAGLAQRGKPKAAGQGAKISATKKALGQKPSLEAARAGNRACLAKRYGHRLESNEIV